MLRRALSTSTELFDWRKAVAAGKDDRRDVIVRQLSAPGGRVVNAWRLVGAWPSRWSGPAFDALRDDGTFDNGLRVRGHAVAPDGESTDFKLVQTGPGRYEGSFPASAVGTWLASLTWTDPRDPSGENLAYMSDDAGRSAPICCRRPLVRSSTQ